MSLLDETDAMPDKDIQFKPHWLFVLAGLAVIAALVFYQAFALAVLGLAAFAVAQGIYVSWLRLSAKTRETEELSRIHFATAEALATAIDANAN